MDSHTEGEPLRILFDFPKIEGATMLAKRRNVFEKYDDLRRALMWEPRGHRDMYGCIVTEAVTPGSDLGVLFIHNEGLSTMCGHGIIAVTTVVLEVGFVEKTFPQTVLRIDTPAGLVTAVAHLEGTPDSPGPVSRVAFRNVPSYVVALDQIVTLEGLGPVTYDLAFGGAYYAYVEASKLGLTPVAAPLVDAGMAIKREIMKTGSILHPTEPDMGFLYGTIFLFPGDRDTSHSRHVCVFAEGEVDRSPTGTGVSGRMAILHRREQVAVGEKIEVESLIGSRFSGTVAEPCSFGGYDAVIPEISGRAYITGVHRFLLDPRDPFKNGFMVR